MDEQHTAARVVDITGTRPPMPRAPFDPAGYLDGLQPPPAPDVAGAVVELVEAFDPAAFLGARALRGAFNLATVKPLVTTIGGVEMVTVPASAYAHALRQVMPQELPAETVQQAGPVPDVEGMLDLLLSLHAADVVSMGQLTRATGLDHLAIGDHVAAFVDRYRGTEAASEEPVPVQFVASPEAARIDVTGETVEEDAPEAHGAALDDGRPTEAHGAALDAAKPGRHSRKIRASHEVP